jgi:hypothetical protein
MIQSAGMNYCDPEQMNAGLDGIELWNRQFAKERFQSAFTRVILGSFVLVTLFFLQK